jgi:hypothetical protein
LATTQLRFSEVVGLAAAARTPPGAEADDTDLFAKVLIEYAQARLGTSHSTPKAIAAWPSESTSPTEMRELSYWCASTLLYRREYTLASSVATSALAGLRDHDNPELEWQLAMVAAQAASAASTSETGATMRALATTSLQRLARIFGSQAAAYFARPDLKELRNKLG